MRTKFGIPQDQLDEIVTRDIDCIYCHKTMILPYDVNNRSDSATIEHLNHRADWDSVRDFVSNGKQVHSIIGLCCGGCNSSRRDLPLLAWFNAEYCKSRKIDEDTVSDVVRSYISEYEK